MFEAYITNTALYPLSLIHIFYKGGTSGFSNLGFEPYSERYAYQVAQVMGVNAIRYTCLLYTSRCV